MYLKEFLIEKIKTGINEFPCTTIQADETLDASCKIIPRYTIEVRVEERFVGLYDISMDKTVVVFTEIIHEVLKKWEITTNKVVGQTCDCATLMVGSEREFCLLLFLYIVIFINLS